MNYLCYIYTFLSIMILFVGSRRPSILPVPDMFTSSAFNINADGHLDDGDGDESEDELDDDVPWRSPSEKIA